MRRRVLIPALIACFAVAFIAASQAEVEQVDGLRVRFNAEFDPQTLPREEAAPVRIKVTGSIATTDGSHPPPLRWLEIELNRAGQLFSKGLPVCSAPLLQSTSTEQARERCGSAIVGSGRFRADVSLGSEIPATGEILAFNSRDGGRSMLLLHFFASVPVRFTLVVPLTIARQDEGEFGTLLRTHVPRLGGGLGSITEIGLTIGRRYSFAGKRRSYLSAACRAPAGFPGASFTFARARFRFESHRPIRTILVRNCKVRKAP
ncbi:MAG TPA: hypothetical protein VN732_07910 [Solirubrobacterales bacterium]|nr:hypothetical protein [Solirubrobacterales bacterium]